MIRSVPADAGVNWLKGGWAAFTDGGAVLIGMSLALLVIVGFLRWIPWLGPVLAPIGGTFLYAGILMSLRGKAGGESLRFESMFRAFDDQDKMVHIAIVALVPVLGSLLQNMLARGFAGWLIGGLIALAVVALTYFALPLVLFRKQDALSAMKLSLEGVVANLPAVIVFWIIVSVLVVLAVLPLLLGLLVLIPVLFGAAYEAYAEIYGDIELDPANSPAGAEPPPPPM
jgi:hypothetical protein